MMNVSSPSHDASSGQPVSVGRGSSRDASVEVFLLDLGNGRPVFYSEAPESRDGDGEGSASGQGVRGWLEQGYRRLQYALARLEGGGGRHTRRLWAWLRRFASPDEPMLRRLRTATLIVLHHPTSMAPEEARSTWKGYLVVRRRHHLIWLVLGLLASPSMLLLAPIPGPNFIGYWVVYRAACHALALLGINRARSRRVTTRLHSSTALDTLLGKTGEERGALVAANLGLKYLDDFIGRVEANRTQSGDPSHGLR